MTKPKEKPDTHGIVTIRMEAGEKNSLEKLAEKNGRSVSSEARIALTNHIKKAK